MDPVTEYVGVDAMAVAANMAVNNRAILVCMVENLD
jgi:hypothetical protein